MTDQDADEGCKGDECLGCQECMECACGCEERVRAGACAWCRADANGRPFGGCVDCGGARDWDASCACKLPGSPELRAEKAKVSFGRPRKRSSRKED